MKTFMIAVHTVAIQLCYCSIMVMDGVVIMGIKIDKIVSRLIRKILI